MDSEIECPVCTVNDVVVSEDGDAECMTCGHEWRPDAADGANGGAALGPITDAHGNLLANGDTVALIKDLKLKGTSSVIKAGTKVKRIRLISGDHEIDCKVDGRAILLKAEFVKKA